MADREETHTCHARGCTTKCPPEMFMCRKHWFSLTREEKASVWGVYVPGQEERMDPTDEYLEVTQQIIEDLHRREVARMR